MGAPAKPKSVRLIDILYCINDNDFIAVTIEHGRKTFCNKVAVIEETMQPYMSSKIQGISVDSGTIHVFL